MAEEQFDFDVSRLGACLQQTLGIDPAALEIEGIRGGQSNPTFLLNSRGTRYVLRKKPAGHLLASAHAIEREYRVMAALAESDVPVPKMRLLCTDSEVIGTPFYVMDYVAGRVLYDPTLPQLAPVERRAAFAEMNRVIAALHRVDYSRVGLDSFGKPHNYLERQIARWTQQYRASETERLTAMERLIEWLPENIPASGSSTIVHGDFRLDNLILHPTEPRVLAVIDWELSTLGDPLADLSYHMQIWRLRSDEFRGMAERDLPALGIPSETEYLAEYCRRTDRAGVDPGAWEFYMAFNAFRLTAILQGVLKRAIDGNATDEKALETGQRARLIAATGWRAVQSSASD
jgi:aminoglycoside phosphotransferase (APT) family kinase protein